MDYISVTMDYNSLSVQIFLDTFEIRVVNHILHRIAVCSNSSTIQCYSVYSRYL